MKSYSTTNSPEWIFNNIVNDFTSGEYRYVILGKIGPTGKTWLWSKLKKDGFDAIELSENLVDDIYYCGFKNYVRVNELDKIVIIILNKPLELKKKTKEIKLIVDDDVDVIHVETLVKDGIGCLVNDSKHVLSDLEDKDKFDLTI